jgi:4-amino-4-deoxy-L-arabinose transferase-like glycosyltransferase
MNETDSLPSPNPIAVASSTRLTRCWVPAILLALFAAQSLWFIGTQSLTYDEPGHIIAGLEAWQHGRFEMWTDHPPLGRFWLTLPLAGAKVKIEQQPLPRGYVVTAMQPGPEWLAWHTRPMNTLLGVALGITLWFATRRLFSVGAANVALALFAFTPSIIANFSVTTTDGIGALFVFLTANQVVLWRRNPTRGQTALLGLVLGGLLLAKLYTPPEALLALVLMLVIAHKDKMPSAWKPALVALLIAAATWWAGYLFHVSHLKVGDGQVVATFPHRETKTWATKSQAKLNVLVPAGEYVEGLREVAFSNHHGRPTWFLSQLYPKGAPWLFYPVTILLKWPMVLLVLFFVSLAKGVRKTCRAPIDLMLVCSFGLVFLAFALQSRFAIGERHILPLYPFAMLIAGGLWEHARQNRLGVVTVILALCLNAADALRSAPDYLTYFNIGVKPQNAWQLLTDSNLDWGQGLIALRKYELQHPGETLHLAYFGSVEPRLYGIKAEPMSPKVPAIGEVVAGASCLSGQMLMEPDSYRWLWKYPPEGMIDRSMLVFDTTKAE